jgi:thiol-disulfide isomerase/thioredoxin
MFRTALFRTALRSPACTLSLLCLLALLASSAPIFATAKESLKRPEVGEVPPDKLGRDRDGVEQTVSKHRGKVVIVTFWASWCGPCRKELPVLGHFQRVVGRDHLEVIAINYMEPRQDFNAVIRANKDIALTYVHDIKGSLSKSYGVEALPNMFIIDQTGKVAFRHRGYSEESLKSIVQDIASLLPEDVLDRPAGR